MTNNRCEFLVNNRCTRQYFDFVTHSCLCRVSRTPLKGTQDGISDEVTRVPFSHKIIDFATPIVVHNSVVGGGVLKYQQIQLLGSSVMSSSAVMPAPAICQALVPALLSITVCYSSVVAVREVIPHHII